MRFLVSKAFLGSLFDVFETSWGAFGASWGSLGSLLEPLGAILGRLGAKLGGLGATFGALRFLIIFWSDFGSKNGAHREAFWEPTRNKNLLKKEVQIQERKSHISESSWCDFGSISTATWAQQC